LPQLFNEMRKLITITICALLFPFVSQAQRSSTAEIFQNVTDSIQSYLSTEASIMAPIAVDKAIISKNRLNIRFKPSISEYPLRERHVKDIYAIVKLLMPAKYAAYKSSFTLTAIGLPLEELASGYFSGETSSQVLREYRRKVSDNNKRPSVPLVTNLSKGYKVTKGLQESHIALWQSHGYYYEQSLKRWEWQRARIFETVEDLYTQSYVLPFLVPMLENAGANVLLPRERDYQLHEVIVDNDTPGSGYSEDGKWKSSPDSGFANIKPYYLYKENPFKLGSARVADAKVIGSRRGTYSTAKWIPEIPEDGDYAVYVSYHTLKNSTEAAQYEVRHKGGSTRFSINQTMGGGTWVYLGTFPFAKGSNSSQGVFLNNNSSSNKDVITADAVKFGGGMGNIARKPSDTDKDGNPVTPDFDVEPEISGYPRYTEGSRYWLQWAGFNDTIYSVNRNYTDYNDDYQSRGMWVNILTDGSYLKPDRIGYNIPIDLSFAFHTDAGTTLTDSIIGTLAIYTRLSMDEDEYPYGVKRSIARDYADIVQTQIVDDIRALFEPQWSRRGMWDKAYAEARSPEVPAMLLELLSHQNLADMRYGLDPAFRFVVSRAIYKGMLKYLSWLRDTPYIVQPLPVRAFSAEITESGRKYQAQLKWEPRVDRLESTANTRSYILYTRVDDGGFDNGVPVNGNSFTLNIEPGKIYSFKVTAVNEGGESFPSEILSVGLADSRSTRVVAKGKTVLIVNNFDRVAAPSSFATRDSTYGGFLDHIDRGVPYLYDISHIGSQYEFRRAIPWMDDDAAGFGASYSDYETKSFAGNTFDYPYYHGLALIRAGYDFVSTSREALTSGAVNPDKYPILDLICGKQITTLTGRDGASTLRYSVFPADLQETLREYAASGGNMLISGANIATDAWDKIYDYQIDSLMMADVINPMRDFITGVLKYKWMTNNATVGCDVKMVQNPFGLPLSSYSFFTKPNPHRYQIENPDGLVPADSNAYTIFRYSDNNISAGVAYEGDYRVVSLGFPIETLQSQSQIDKIIKELMEFLDN